MKLDKELVRAILLRVEESDHTPGRPTGVMIDGWSRAEINYHLRLLEEGGLVLARDIGGLGEEPFWVAERLTYKGHEALEAIGDPEVWRRTKERAVKAGAASLHLVVEIGKAYAKQVAQERLGLHLG